MKDTSKLKDHPAASSCCACGASTLIHRRNLYPITLIAALLDYTLRSSMYQGENYQAHASNNQPWSALNLLTELIPSVMAEKELWQHQGLVLAQSIEKNWLGGFDSLCLSCGFMLVDEDRSQ